MYRPQLPTSHRPPPSLLPCCEDHVPTASSHCRIPYGRPPIAQILDRKVATTAPTLPTGKGSAALSVLHPVKRRSARAGGKASKYTALIVPTLQTRNWRPVTDGVLSTVAQVAKLGLELKYLVFVFSLSLSLFRFNPKPWEVAQARSAEVPRRGNCPGSSGQLFPQPLPAR
jgi:hypothetical protein